MSRGMRVLIVMCALLALCSPQASKGGKPGKGSKYPRVNHHLYNIGLTWAEAQEECEQGNSHLALLESPGEVNTLTRLIATSTTSYYVFIGMHDLQNRKHFIVLEENHNNDNDDNFLGEEWGLHEQNQQEADGEKCVVMNRLGQLGSVSCKLKYPFICES